MLFVEYSAMESFLEEASLIERILNNSSVGDDIKSSACIAGGCLRAIFAREKISDVDLYPYTQEGCNQLANRIRSEANKDTNNLTIIYESNLAVTFKENGMTYQLISNPELIVKGESHTRRVEGVKDLLSRFDFTIGMAAYVPIDDTIVMHESFFNHLAQRKIVFNPDTQFPIPSLARIRKFVKRGYTFDDRELVKMGVAIARLNIETMEDLAQELRGLDEPLMGGLYARLQSHGNREFDWDTMIDDIEREISVQLSSNFTSTHNYGVSPLSDLIPF